MTLIICSNASFKLHPSPSDKKKNLIKTLHPSPQLYTPRLDYLGDDLLLIIHAIFLDYF